MTDKATSANKISIVTVLIAMAVFLLYSAATYAYGQSVNLDFPTAVTGEKITGRIKARDLGDARLTSHYYLFEGDTGDVYLKIESSNLNGDIDIYTAGSLKPMLKASVYAGSYATAMQREIYLRLPQRLILRVEGRTPNDDPADYSITFSGKFRPIAASAVIKDPGGPKVSGAGGSGAVARVNSAGTIIEEIKPPAPPRPEPRAEVKKATPKETAKETAAKEKPKTSPTANPAATGAKPKTSPKIEPLKTTTVKPPAAAAKKTSPPPTVKKPVEKAPAKTAKPTKPAADPLAEVDLVLEMKDGTKLRYKMTDVLRVSVDKNIVTIILKNGGIERRSLLDIEEMKIGQ